MLLHSHAGQLLDHIGGDINPLRVIQKIPEGLAIDKLRDRLRHIISDFRTQTSLREGCNAILRSDCLHLVQRLQMEVKRALPVVWVQRIGSHGTAPTGAQLAAAAAAAEGGLGTAEQQQSNASSTRKASVAGAAADQQQQQQQNGSKAAAGAAGGTKAGGTAAGRGFGAGSVPGSTDVSPIKHRPAARAAANGFLPAGAPAGRGPQWLKYSCCSGQAMAVASSQDVPASAALEPGSGRSPLPWVSCLTAVCG